MTTTTARKPNRFLGLVAAVVLSAAMAAATALSMSPAIAGPRHVCSGYVKIPPRNQMSDLHGGAITQWLPKCHLVH